MENLGVNTLLNNFRNKKILITGHTGFKGSWLSIWLHLLGAEVIGIALDSRTSKDNYIISNAHNNLKDHRQDIRCFEKVLEIFQKEKPDIVYHLAAQPLVLESYNNPHETFQTNTLGTANILEAIRLTDSVKVGIIVTTDKVYENKEWIWPYRETDRIGGHDPYSGSKGAAEIIISSYIKSFFNPQKYEEHQKSIASVRAGNVIGGGDWSENRIVPDCIKAIENNKIIEVRSPLSIRPWQHVLEPLSGYLILGAKMLMDPIHYSGAWNFGPESDSLFNVKTLVSSLIKSYGKGEWKDVSDKTLLHEAKSLTLDISKAKYRLNWKPIFSFAENIDYTVKWYKNYKTNSQITYIQVKTYQEKMEKAYES